MAAALIARGDKVTALCIENNPTPAGVNMVRYTLKSGNTPHIHPWVQDTETKVIRGKACCLAAQQLRSQGYMPDIVCVHPGWGEALFIKEIWPSVPLLSYFEFYYHPHGADVGFDPEFPSSENGAPRLMNLEQCDAGVSPTAWQKSARPTSFQHKIRVIHESVDTDAIRPAADTSINLDGGITLRPGDEVIAFVNRNLEPYRGCHSFFRAMAAIQRRRPLARIVIVGGDRVSYGVKL